MQDNQTETTVRRGNKTGWCYYDPDVGWRFSFAFIPHAERMTLALFKALHQDGYVHER